jgi:protein-disulfide isomerase
VLATIGGQPVTLADAEARAGSDLQKLELQYQRARHQNIQNALMQILRDRVLAAEAARVGKTVEQLAADEVGGRIAVTDTDVAAWYAQNQQRLGGRSLDELKPQIAEFLRQQRTQEGMQRLQERVFRERQVSVLLQPFRYSLNNEGAPAKGPATAAVTLVEFSDFQCPFCARWVPTLNQLQQEFGDQLRIVYRQLPITSIHPAAFKAAEASLCAHDQGRFWELHDALFADPQRLNVTDLKARARELGLDGTRFDTCLDTGRATERVQNDLREAERIGINGTPALFINGIFLEGGALPFEVVAAAIREELERQKAAR